MSDIKVSVIIPVYNGGQAFKKCLYDVMNQTLKDIEIICVDDGSTDESAQIISQAALEDSRIQYVYQNNQELQLQEIKVWNMRLVNMYLFLMQMIFMKLKC